MTPEETKGVIATITAARNVFANFGHTRFVMAENAEGKSVAPTDIDACKFCTMGAVLAVTRKMDERYFRAVDELERVTGGKVSLWNDRPERTTADCLALIDSTVGFLKAGIAKIAAEEAAARLAAVRPNATVSA